jgi:hypothetical protein
MKRETLSPDSKNVSKVTLPKWSAAFLSPEDPADREKVLQRGIRLLVVLNAASIVMALFLFAGLFFAWSANSSLMQVRQEIQALQQFEKRITARIEVMNNGVQNRLSKLDQRMASVQSDVGLVIKGRRDPALMVENIATMVRNEGGYFGSATAEMMLTPELSLQDVNRFEPRQTVPGMSFAVDATETDSGASLFNRVITADGKVRYEMKR